MSNMFVIVLAKLPLLLLVYEFYIFSVLCTLLHLFIVKIFSVKRFQWRTYCNYTVLVKIRKLNVKRGLILCQISQYKLPHNDLVYPEMSTLLLHLTFLYSENTNPVQQITKRISANLHQSAHSVNSIHFKVVRRADIM